MTRFIRHHRTTRRWLVSVVAAGAVIVSMVAIRAQADQFQLFVVASDANGAPVSDLKVEDVSMAESGMPGKVITVERANLPIKLTIVVDNGPDSDRLLEHYRTGLTALADALPPDLEVSLYTNAPAPRLQVKPSVDRMELKRAFTRLGRDGEDPRFSDSIVEYSQRLDKEAKELKVPYMPALIVLSTIAGDPSSYQLGDIEKAIAVIQQRGGKGFVAVSTSKLNDNTARNDLTIGRQGTIGAKLAKSTRGDFQALPDPKALATVLPEWGKQIAASHTKQTTQYRLVLQRPAGVSGPLNTKNLDLRITRPGVKPSAVSGDGRF